MTEFAHQHASGSTMENYPRIRARRTTKILNVRKAQTQQQQNLEVNNSFYGFDDA